MDHHTTFYGPDNLFDPSASKTAMTNVLNMNEIKFRSRSMRRPIEALHTVPGPGKVS